jgi:O-antigen/teichoic acid export membrane protein
MMEDERSFRRPRLGGASTATVVIGSFVSGLGGYVFQIVATRTLGSEVYAPLGVLWTIQYLVLTVGLLPAETYLTRAIALDVHGKALLHSLRSLTFWLLSVGVLVGGATWSFRGSLFGDETVHYPLVALLLAMSFAGFVLTRGWLAGHGQFHPYGVVTASESIARLLAVLIVVSAATGPYPIAWTLVVGPALGAVLGYVLASRIRVGLVTEKISNLTPRRFLTVTYVTSTTVANGASQAILAMPPLLLVVFGAPPEAISVVFLTVMLARAPLVFAYGGLLSRILPPLVGLARRGESRLLKRITVVLVAAAGFISVGAGLLGGAIGPWSIAVVFGGGFRPDALLVAVAVAAVVIAASALIINQILIAMGREKRLMLPWILAFLGSVTAGLLIPGSESLRSVWAMLGGQLVALVCLAAAVLTTEPLYEIKGAEVEALTQPLGLVE